MPDGTCFFGIARSIGRGGGWRVPRKTFAIGPGCRVCPRSDCVQRAFPPIGQTLETDFNAEFLGSYRFKETAKN